MMEEFLKTFGIIQERKSKDPFGSFYTQDRLNPYNPLTYIFILVMILISLVLYGIVGSYDDWQNPFKWR